MKFNSLLEVYLVIPFLVLIFSILKSYNDLVYISYVLLIKELLLFIFRMNKIKKKINNLITIHVNLLLVILNLIISIYYEAQFYTFFNTIHFQFYNIFKSLKK